MSNQRAESLRRRLDEYYKAESKILRAQSYTIDNRQLTRSSLAAVQAKIKELEAELDALEDRGSTKRRTVRAVPLD